MKQLLTVVATFLGTIAMCGSSFGGVQYSSLVKNSPTIKALGMVWKTPPLIHAKQNKNGIHMVYGGADISRRFTIISHTTTA